MQRIWLLATCVMLVVGCAQQPATQPNVMFERPDGQPANDADRAKFEQDKAGCNYDMQRMAYMAPNRYVQTAPMSYADPQVGAIAGNIGQMFSNPHPAPPFSMFVNCMEAHGWRPHSTQ